MEAGRMARRSKQEDGPAMHERDGQATRAETRAMRDEVTQGWGDHRPSAIGRLPRLAPPRPRPRRGSRRRPIYREEAMRILAWSWEASGYVGATRLKAALPVWGRGGGRPSRSRSRERTGGTAGHGGTSGLGKMFR